MNSRPVSRRIFGDFERIAQTQRRSRRLSGPEPTGPIDKTDHLGGRMNRQPMRRETPSGQDVRRHVPNRFKLLFTGLCQQRNDEVFERDDAHLKLHQLGVAQRWRIGLWLAKAGARVRVGGPCAALVLPTFECASAQGLRRIGAAIRCVGRFEGHARDVLEGSSEPGCVTVPSGTLSTCTCSHHSSSARCHSLLPWMRVKCASGLASSLST